MDTIRKDFYDFLCEFAIEELLNAGVLYRGKYGTYILQGRSIIPLIRLMNGKNIKILTYNDEPFLDLKSKEFSDIDIGKLTEDERETIEKNGAKNLRIKIRY